MKLHYFLPVFFFFSCGENKTPQQEPAPETAKTIGKIERMSPGLDAILAADAKIEVLAEGYDWSEGPVWVTAEGGGYLLFTDVPQNKIFKWKEGEGASLYLTPSGFTGDTTDSTEPGANGLTLDAQGNLVMCQHGDRRIARMSAPPDQPKPTFETLADKWNGKRFNSPNDLVFDKNGNLYFTDPPYGLKGHTESPLKEIPFQGVYRRNANGSVDMLVDSLTRPNGIALSPDEKMLFVANSDPEKAWLVAYDLQPDGKLANGHIFHDATASVGEQLKGLPDGMKINSNGIIFATGPGGVMIFTMDGTLLGRINPGEATANCALGGGGYLYLTSDAYLCRVRLN
ncbi:MAG: SMP-30/gluconolactonase/LRE family protein [Bacteroidetes bacterium]|nr:SMP-30/gluconolactonase/LRE family protein [Bacteroidota bacterium]